MTLSLMAQIFWHEFVY